MERTDGYGIGLRVGAGVADMLPAVRRVGDAFRELHATLVRCGFINPKTGAVHQPYADLRADIMRRCAGNRRRQGRRQHRHG